MPQKDSEAGRLAAFILCLNLPTDTRHMCWPPLRMSRHKTHSEMDGQGSLKGNWLDIPPMILVIMGSIMIINIQEINKANKQ